MTSERIFPYAGSLLYRGPCLVRVFDRCVVCQSPHDCPLRQLLLSVLQVQLARCRDRRIIRHKNWILAGGLVLMASEYRIYSWNLLSWLAHDSLG